MFRETWFRAHPEAVPPYGGFKVVLAASVPNLDVYTDVKDPVVDLVIAVAESWAASTTLATVKGRYRARTAPS